MLRKNFVLATVLATLVPLTASVADDGQVAYLSERWRTAIEQRAPSDAMADQIEATDAGYIVDASAYEAGTWIGSFRVRTDLALNVLSEAAYPLPIPRFCVPSMDWQPDFQVNGEPLPAVLCARVATDSSGTRYFVDGDSDQYIAIAADGARRVRSLGFDARMWEAIAVPDPDGGAVIAVPKEDGDLLLIAVDARARLRWQSDGGTFTSGDRLRLVHQGNVVVLLTQNAQTLRVRRVSLLQGEISSLAVLTVGAQQRLDGASVDASGNVFVLLNDVGADDGRFALHRIGAHGATTLETEVQCDENTSGEFGGDIVAPRVPIQCGLVSRGTNTHWLSVEGDRLHLYRSTDEVPERDVWNGAYDAVSTAVIGADGASVLVAVEPFNFDVGPTGILPRRIVRVGTAAGDVRNPIAITQVLTVSAQAQFDAQGGLIEWAGQYPQATVVRRFDANGQQLWRHEFATSQLATAPSASQVCASTSTSVDATTSSVSCLRLADGTPSLHAIVDGVIRPHQLLAAPTAGRAIAVLGSTNIADPIVRVVELRAGVPARTLSSGLQNPMLLLDAHEALWVIDNGSSPHRVDRFDADGNALATVTLPATAEVVHDARFDSLDRLWITYGASGSSDVKLARIDAQGQFADANPPVVYARVIAGIANTAAGTYAQLNRHADSHDEVTTGSAIVAIDPNGQLRWQHIDPSALPNEQALHADADRVRYLKRDHVGIGQRELIDLDPASGNVRAQWALPWPNGGASSFSPMRLAAPDRIDYASNLGKQWLVGSTGLTSAIAVNDFASAFNGAWSMPGLGGQGFAFEYNAAVRLLSAAWYSHDSARPHDFDPAALSWNTLLGALSAPDAGEVSMTIYANASGAFDDLPTTTSTQVGVATLRVTGCDQLTMSYAFGQDAPRLVALQRASPRTQPCTLRTLSTGATSVLVPTYLARSDLGGVWFEPRTSGQGAHVVVYPPGGAGAAETVGLGWFTYDPANAADDGMRQHWFTAAGSFDDSTQQRASLTVYRTTGGDRANTATRNTHRVGTATLQRIDCDSATLSYQFDDTLVAAAFATKARTIPLQRLGACP